MGTHFVAHHSIPIQIEHQRIESAALRPDLVGPAAPSVEEDAPTIPVAQNQIEVPVLSAKAAEARALEPIHIGLGQRHLRIDATEVAVMPLTGIRRTFTHAAIVPHPCPQ